MLASALKALDKRFKMEILMCIQHIKISKSNCFLHKSYRLFLFFKSLTSNLLTRPLIFKDEIFLKSSYNYGHVVYANLHLLRDDMTI